ncbi:hypothetical protein BJ166DRAFT_17697 [Pestalotiopsis sp. NC0098]|nr:hypothetical protein BJ166DRAFT_17697 [Pestalotiopsis sp. NC0098]
MRWLAPTFPDPPRKVHGLIPISSHTGPQDELCFLSSTVLLPLLLFFSAEYQTARWLGKSQHRLEKNSGTRPLEYTFASFKCRSFGQGYSLVFTFHSTLQEESCISACRVLYSQRSAGGGGGRIHNSMCSVLTCHDSRRELVKLPGLRREMRERRSAFIKKMETPFWAETPPSPFGYRQGTPSPKSDKLAAGCSKTPSRLYFRYIPRARLPMTNASHWPYASLGLSNSIEVPMGADFANMGAESMHVCMNSFNTRKTCSFSLSLLSAPPAKIYRTAREGMQSTAITATCDTRKADPRDQECMFRGLAPWMTNPGYLPWGRGSSSDDIALIYMVA